MGPLRRQAAWDELILDGWKADKPMWWIIREWGRRFGFADQFGGIKRDRTWAILAELAKLPRPPPAHINYAMPVRAFVSAYLRPLSELLWQRFDKAEAMRLLRTLRPERFSARLPRRGPTNLAGRRYVFTVRDRDKRHDWKTVK